MNLNVLLCKLPIGIIRNFYHQSVIVQKNTEMPVFPGISVFCHTLLLLYAILIFIHFSSAVCADVLPDSLFQNCAGAGPHTVQLQRNWTDSGNGYRQSSGYGYMFPHYRPEFLPEFRHFPCQT